MGLIYAAYTKTVDSLIIDLENAKATRKEIERRIAQDGSDKGAEKELAVIKAEILSLNLQLREIG